MNLARLPKWQRPLMPLPPMPRIWNGARGWLNDHQARRRLANKCIKLINSDRRAQQSDVPY